MISAVRPHPGATSGERALVDPPYRGEAPLESCHLQAISNILEALGFADAQRKVVLSWGFQWDGVGGQLQNGRRWIELANRAYGVGIERVRFDRWSDAAAFERDLTARELPFVAAVDAFYVPSEHEGRTHFPHTLIVLRSRADGAEIVDPMNLPEPRRYPRSVYEAMRTHECVPEYHLYYAASAPERRSPEEERRRILDALAVNVRAWPASLRALDSYIAAMEESDAPIDVAHPAAERLYLSGLFRALVEDDPALEGCAASFASLTKRWYFVHTLSMQTHERRPEQRARLIRLMAELRERELALVERVSLLVGEEPPVTSPHADHALRRSESRRRTDPT